MKSHTQKHLLFLCFIFCFILKAGSQNISNYTFTATSGTFMALSGSTAPSVSGGSTNDGWYNSIPIGFEFWFMGTRYDKVGASTNGWLTFGLGSTAIISAGAANTFISGIPKPFVAPLWDDLDFTQSLGVFSYQTTGTAPNRIFTAEWLNAEWGWSANNPVISFQVKLYETTGKIDFIYRQESTAVAGGSASIGIEGSSTFQSLNGTGTSPSSSTTVNTMNLNVKPATGQVYSFTPPVPSAPIGLTFSSVTSNSMTLNWSDNATNEFGYVIYISTDNITFTFQAQLAANSTSSSMLSLSSSTTYYYKIYAVTEGGFSNSLTGSRTTLVGTLGGVISIPGTYATITAAITALQTNGFANSVILELQSSYTSSGETFPINIPSNLGTTPTKTVTLRPASGVSNITVSSNTNAGIININGCKYFTIDGRPGGTGTTKALTINNDNIYNGSTINFVNDASNDTIRYCNITGNTPSSYVVWIGNTNGITGNDNNSIEYCNIHSGVLASVNTLIYCGGTLGKDNNSNTIANNNLFDFMGIGNNGAYGINVGNGCTDFRITGNHIYQTQSITASNSFTMCGICFFNSSGNITISNNYIGGSAPNCGGNAWELGSVSTPNQIVPINIISSSTTLPSTINGNTISNFMLASNFSGNGFPISNYSTFSGISVAGLCTINGNTIGSSTGIGNISVVSEYVGYAAVYGIYTNGSANKTISNNFIGSFDVSGTLSTHVVLLYGIATSYSQVTGNTITLLMNESASAYLYGISSNGNDNISQNTISNLFSTNASSQVSVCGIFVNGKYDTISRNFIHGFSIASSSASASLTGISLNSIFSPEGEFVKNNMIQLGIKPDGTSLTAPCIIYGIIKGNGYINLLHNSIYIGGAGVATGAGNSACFYRNGAGSIADTVFNNIFYNARTNGSTGGNHYSLILNSTTLLKCNSNVHYTGSSSSCMIRLNSTGTDYTSFNNYQTSSGLEIGSSDTLDPKFINATGSSTTVNLHISATLGTPVEANGSGAHTVSDDFDGQIRSSFSPVDIGADAGNFIHIALPVKWLSFEGRLENKKTVQLNWSTASEINNDHFEVERKVGRMQDAASNLPAGQAGWETVGKVKGNGNTNHISLYEFTDVMLSRAEAYYRLKQVDRNGNFEYSKTIAIALNEMRDAIIIYPNPFTDKFELLLPDNFNNDAITIDVRDVQGRSAFTQTYPLQKGQVKIAVESNTLNSGIYFVNFTTKDGVSKYQKLVKE